jgi:hypothetical protein
MPSNAEKVTVYGKEGPTNRTVGGWRLLPVTFLFGVATGWVPERTGSTLPFFAIHVLNNVLMLAVAYALVAGSLAP